MAPNEAPEADRYWMLQAIELSRLCPPSQGAYSVGAIIVDAEGRELARGFSRENDPHVHAEEAALGKLDPEDPRLRTATMYSTLEPCSDRRSPRPTCTNLILAAGIPRVVIAWLEPDLFVDCKGVVLLSEAGVDVVMLDDLESEARRANIHLPTIDR